ncbi:MAG: caspase family protein [Rhodomicrobium sp.]
MRWIAVVLGLLLAAAGARAEGPILQLDTGGHMALIKGLAFTPDGKFIVSASNDKVIRVWDWRAGKTVRTIRGQSGPGQEGKIFAMALSPDGRWLAVGGLLANFDGTNHIDIGAIRLYDFASGEMKALLKGHTNVVMGLAFSPDGKTLISGGGDSTAILWDVETKTLRRRLEGHRDDIYAVGFTPDGARAVTGSYDKTLRLWSVADGALIKEMPGHGDKVISLAVSPRNGAIASGDTSGEIRLWDGKTGALKKVFANQHTAVGALRFSPDGKLLLSTCGQGHPCHDHIWKVESGTEAAAHKIDEDIVLASAFSPDGGLVATGGGDNNEIHVWDPKTGETKAALKGAGRPGWAVGFSADGRSIAWGNTWTQHDPKSGYGPLEFALRLPSLGETLSPPEAVTSAEGWVRAKASFGALSLQHRKGGSYGYDAILEVLKDGKPTGVSIERGSTDGYGHWAYSFTPDGKTIVSGGVGGFLTAYGLDGKKIGDFAGHESEVWAVAASPDGRILVSGSADQTVRLWNLKTRELLLTIFRGEDGEWVAWTPEGFYTGSEGAAKLVGWQINQGPDKAAKYITAGQLRKALFRPDLVTAKILGDPDGLVKQAAAKVDLDELLKTSLAPRVAILSPENGAKLGDASVSITARIVDEGGGIGRIRFRLNGQVVDSLYGAGMLAKDGTITRSFDLAAADTEIEIVAEDTAGKIQSLPAKIAVHANPKAIAGAPDLYILAIGADAYRDRRVRLNYSVKDAAALAETFGAAGAGLYRNPPIVKTLFDGDVTAAKIEAAFEELGAKAKATDVFVFYIAGHGKTLDGDFYFVPPSVDTYTDEALKAQGFGPSKLWPWFEKIKAQKSIWIFDACESGSAGRVFKRGLAEADAALKRLKDATGRTIFMAASEQQAALEGYRNHGVFTYALLESLAKAGGGERVQLYDIADYVQTRVPEISRELSGCEVKDAAEFCQKPIVGIGSTPNYPVMPRYPQVLAMLGAPAPTDGSPVPLKPTHAVIAAADVFEAATRGAAKRQIDAGELVAVLKIENGVAKIAQDGAVLGYVDETKLLKLKR